MDLICSKDFTEFEFEREGMRLRVVRAVGARPVVELSPSTGGGVVVESVTGSVAAIPAEPAADSSDLHTVKSPMVGTFYRSANPSAEPFVKVGDPVKKGQVICIIEAMKLMNEIECEVSGVVQSVVAENGQPVEYGEPLFKIRTGN